jgi:hypothetical protein
VNVHIHTLTHGRSFPTQACNANSYYVGLYHNLFTLSYKRTILENKVVQNEMCFDGLYKIMTEKKPCHILMKLEDCRRIFEEYSNTKFNLNLSGGS